MRSILPIKLSLPARIASWLFVGSIIGLSCGPVCNRVLLNNGLFEAAIAGNSDQIQELIDRGADINAQDSYGDTPLMYAARNGHSQAARLLIALGAGVNARDAFGITAADWADTHKYEYRILSNAYGGEVRKCVRREYRETLALLKSSGARL